MFSPLYIFMLRRGKAGFKQDLFDKRRAIDWSNEVGIYLKIHKLGDQCTNYSSSPLTVVWQRVPRQDICCAVHSNWPLLATIIMIMYMNCPLPFWIPVIVHYPSLPNDVKEFALSIYITAHHKDKVIFGQVPLLWVYLLEHYAYRLIEPSKPSELFMSYPSPYRGW